MKNNKIIAYGIIASIALSVLTAFMGWSEDYYTLAGLGFWVFGIWASVVLLNHSK